MPELPQVATSDQAAHELSCDALVVGAFSGSDGIELDATGAQVDRVLAGGLSEYLAAATFKAKTGEIALVPTFGKTPAAAIAVAGLGPRDTFEGAAVRRAAGTAARRLGKRAEIACSLHATGGHVQAAAEGLLLGSYRFNIYKSDDSTGPQRRFTLPGAATADLKRAATYAGATWFARDLVNEPAATLTPALLAERALEAAEESGLEAEVWDEKRLTKEGFGGILGVAQGSDRPPRFIQLRYRPEDAAGKVALIGKGITFDSGGLSLKDASNMETMKTDMGGAAAVIAAMRAIGELKPNIEVNAFVSTTENMPGGRAIKPGDVIKHYGGKTSEVLNTDAEGRLVLADALAYASEIGHDAMVDVATLTGSMMVALGKKATGFFASDDNLAEELRDASARAGERMWQMPIYDEYRKELDSEIADMKNVGTRWGGAIIAALFLKEFVDPKIPWAHLDIAGPARADGDYEEMTKGGTGVAARTLVAWVEGRAR